MESESANKVGTKNGAQTIDRLQKNWELQAVGFGRNGKRGEVGKFRGQANGSLTGSSESTVSEYTEEGCLTRSNGMFYMRVLNCLVKQNIIFLKKITYYTVYELR